MFACASWLWIAFAVAAENGEPVRVDLDHGFYLVSKPVGFDDADPLPLVICLHGTDTTAADILKFWRSFDHTLPMILVAPQGTLAGWREDDSVLMDEFLENISATLGYDPGRVLLTGHSAGGAMAFHLLYVEGFPATALVATACYVPPTVKPEHVRRHSQVPIFYAVGQSDINRGRMRDGLDLLRGHGASVTTRRPRIGHVLDREIGQAALAWFESLCREQVDTVLDRARAEIKDGRSPGPTASELEEVVRHRSTQFDDQVQSALDLLAELQRPGWQGLLRAEKLQLDGRFLQARDELLRIEQQYHPSSLGNEARRRRQEIEALPQVAEVLQLERTMVEQTSALELWQACQKAAAENRSADAIAGCRELLRLHPTGPHAAEARRMLESLEAAGS